MRVRFAGAPAQLVIEMANDTGGKYYYVEDPQDLEPAFAHVSDDLRTQYVVGYYAPQRGADEGRMRARAPGLAAGSSPDVPVGGRLW